MTLLESLPHTADVYRRSWRNDQYGAAFPAGETKIKSDLACWVQSASSAAITEARQRDQRVTHQILCNADPALRLEDIVIPSAGVFANERFTIHSFGERTSGLGWMWVLYVERDEADPPTRFK